MLMGIVSNYDESIINTVTVFPNTHLVFLPTAEAAVLLMQEHLSFAEVKFLMNILILL